LNGKSQAQNATINQIHFSNDSSEINGFVLNNQSIALPHAIKLIQWGESTNLQHHILPSIKSVTKLDDGFQLQVQFLNTSSDTVILDNVVPFEINNENVYIVYREHIYLFQVKRLLM